MVDIPRQGYPNSTLPVVAQNTVPDTIPGITQIYASASGAIMAKDGLGNIITLGGVGGSGTVTSVVATGDGTVLSGTPSNAVTTSGSLNLTLANAPGNTVLAGAVGGGSATPTYRKVINNDITGTNSTTGYVLTSTGVSSSPTWQAPASGSGSVSSVTFTGDGAMLSNTPSAAVTSSGTVSATLQPSAGNTLWASPVGGGSGNASYRKGVAADLIGTGSLSGQVLTSTGATNAPTWQNPTGGGGSGSVTSVAFQGDGTVLSSTPSAAVTTSGNVTASLAAVGGNVLLASPVNGTTAVPTYRKAINTDLVGTNSTSGQVLTSAGVAAQPTWQNPATGTVTSVGFVGDGTLLDSVPLTPVTTSGNVAAGLAAAPQNQVWAGPASGGTGTPNYRRVVADDMTSTGSTSAGRLLYSAAGSAAPAWGDKYAAIDTPNRFRGIDGSVASPMYAFNANATAQASGMWRDASNLNFAYNGVNKIAVSATETASTQPVSIAGATSGKVIQAASATTTTYTITWPSTVSAGTLQIDGSGNITFASGGSLTYYEFSCCQAGAYQRAQNGAYFMNVGIALSEDVFWYSDGTGTIRNARGYIVLDTGTMNVTFTVYKNGSPTGITTGTISASSTFQTWSATGTAVSLVAGDQVGLAIITTSGTPKVTCLGNVKIRQP